MYPELNKLASQVTELQQRLSGMSNVVVATGRDQVLAALEREVPEWRAQNEDPVFIGWLAQNDMYSGVPRSTLLAQALESNDSARVIAIFNGFRSENAAVTPPASTDTPIPERAGPVVDMETLVVPGKSKNTGSSAPEETVWTEPEIAAFYSDVRRGKFENNPDEQKRIEKSIFNAVGAGQVRS